MRLEDLVPPLELCKKIPAGCFEDSLFVWRKGYKSTPISLEFREEWTPHEQFPAPTLAEIMEAFAEKYFYVGHACPPGKSWVVASKREGGAFDANPATAALKLYLEVMEK